MDRKELINNSDLKPENKMDGRELKRIALTPFENYLANVIWVFFSISFFFMTVIITCKYNITIMTLELYVIETWEEFVEIWIQAFYASAVVTFLLITFFKYRENRKDNKENST